MLIADLHIHSHYARATSRDCVPEALDRHARRKGIHLLGTGDFTHPGWRAELNEKLRPAEEGLYTLREEYRLPAGVAGEGEEPRFVVSGEISSIYKQGGRVRKVHNLILLPSLEAAASLSHRLEAIGNLHSDGRPILGLSSRDLLEITLDVCPEAVFIPAHIWTPHFSLFGAYSGFDTIEECFGDLTGEIHALETGLSSDPPMNWRLSALDRYLLVSNSDAHSPQKLGRECNLLTCSMSYPALRQAIGGERHEGFYGTIEFFPEEGKYHYDGHRKCGVCLRPAETGEQGGRCPVCGGRITVGVLHRVEELADRPEGYRPAVAKPFESLVPLPEVIAASTGLGSGSVRVQKQYDYLLRQLGPEFQILRGTPVGEIERCAGGYVAEGVRRLRAGQVEVRPGYDGEYGRVQILSEHERGLLTGQLFFFGEEAAAPPKKREHTLEPRPAAKEAAAREAPGPEGLSAEQHEAAASAAPAVAVIAGPGTGKTRTLVGRVAELIGQRGAKPSEITAVTFTNKAAGEMRQRLQKTLGKRAANALQIGTFHSISLELIPQTERPAVVDEYGALALVEDILKARGIKGKARDLLDAISRRKNGLPEKHALPDGVFEDYCAALTQYGAMDYDDILLRALALFGDERQAKKLHSRFTHLLIDEFQDISDTQYRLIECWGQKSKSIFAIGDPDQSIYGFRGSSARCFERFLQERPGALTVRLRQNYRSTPEILGAALPLIEADGPPRGLWPQRQSGEQVRILKAEDPYSEAIFIAKEIGRMVGGVDMLEAHGAKEGQSRENLSFSDIGVLYRTHRQAALIEECLQKEGIPYVVAGRDGLLAERPVRRVLDFLRYLWEPHDLLSLRGWLRAENMGADGIIGRYRMGEQTPERLALLLQGEEEGGALAELIARFAPLIGKGRPDALLELWCRSREIFDPALERLQNTAVLYETLEDFLLNLALGRESDVVRSGGRTYAPDAVHFSTLHGAKGLEFPVVFLCGAQKDLLPLKGKDCDMAEERRLFYVGLTRAKDELLVLYSGEPSEFLPRLPDGPCVRGKAEVRRRALELGRQMSLF